MNKTIIFLILVVGVLFLSGCSTEKESPFSKIKKIESSEPHAFPEYHARMDPAFLIMDFAEGEMTPIEQLMIVNFFSIYYTALEFENPEICYYSEFIKELGEDGYICNDFLYNSEEVLIAWGLVDLDEDGDVDYFDFYYGTLEDTQMTFNELSRIMRLSP